MAGIKHNWESVAVLEQKNHLLPFSLLATVHADRNRVLIGSDDPLNVVLFEGGREVGKGIGSILSENTLEAVVSDTATVSDISTCRIQDPLPANV